MQKPFPSVLSKVVYQVALRIYSKSSQKKPAKNKNTSRNTFSKKFLVIVSERFTWKQRRDILAPEKGWQLIKLFPPLVINHLSWYGAVYSRPCFCVQRQKNEYSGSFKAGASKASSWTKSTKLVRSKRKYLKSCLPMQTPSRPKFVLSSCQALKFADSNIGWCRNWTFTVGLCSTTSY